MKKLVSLAIMIGVLVIITACGAANGNSTPPSTMPVPIPVSRPSSGGAGPVASSNNDTSSTSTPGDVISGIVKDFTDTELAILTADGVTFRFDITHAEMEVPAEGISIGDVALIHYTGQLDENAPVQDVLIQKLIVTKT